MSFRFLKNEKKRKWDFSPSVSGSVAVRLTITANLYPLLYPLSQYITLKGTGSNMVIYQIHTRTLTLTTSESLQEIGR